ITIYNNDISIFEQLTFLFNFLMLISEPLIMCCTNVCKNSYGGLHNIPEMPHLTRFRNAGLKNAKLMLSLHLPNRKRDPDLGIIAAGILHHMVILRQQLKEPFFDN